MSINVSNIYWNKKVYKNWLKTRPISLKWMLLVILVFPFFAATWEMKKSSGFSPLQLLGLLVFGFAIMSNLKKQTKTD